MWFICNHLLFFVSWLDHKFFQICVILATWDSDLSGIARCYDNTHNKNIMSKEKKTNNHHSQNVTNVTFFGMESILFMSVVWLPQSILFALPWSWPGYNNECLSWWLFWRGCLAHCPSHLQRKKKKSDRLGKCTENSFAAGENSWYGRILI